MRNLQLCQDSSVQLLCVQYTVSLRRIREAIHLCPGIRIERPCHRTQKEQQAASQNGVYHVRLNGRYKHTEGCFVETGQAADVCAYLAWALGIRTWRRLSNRMASIIRCKRSITWWGKTSDKLGVLELCGVCDVGPRVPYNFEKLSNV